ncbi:MAG TPA: hypothetical protein VFG42_23280 [Baekduia sp.]|uniref:hypothetical protein n=1 Tax=Baekduia sp. TaxID=2600305 RepID=UPI002D7696AC|nr:hypothetical protein [Baekduia sp.]HET6509738.1 hypothetical protein [Baekduia sp.]
MRRAVPMLFALVALVAAGAAGCGGSGSGKPSGTTSSKADYVTRVQEASGRVQQALAEISDQGAGTVTAASYGKALDRSVAALDRAVKELDAIPPPRGAKSAHDLLVAGCRELADAFRATARAAHENDPSALAKALRRVSTGDGAKKIGVASAQLKALGLAIAQR